MARKDYILLGLVVLFSLPVVGAYWHAGYFPTHDGEWAVVRLADMIRSLRDGQFPVRWSSYLNHGYGYPLFNFAYPFPYYLGAMVHFVLRAGLVDTIKIIFIASVPLSAVGMFLLAHRLWKNGWSALLSALLYIYFPYRMVDLYVRGSIGESISLVLFPFIILFGLSERVFVTAFLVALLIITHNIMAVEFLPVFGVMLLSYLVARNFVATKKVVVSVFLGLGLAAFFWVPALLEKKYILLAKIPIADRSLYFLNFPDLWTPKWGYGMPGTPGGFGYQLGWPHLAVLALILASIVWFKKREMFMLLGVGLVGLYSFMLFPVSMFLWKLPLFSEINYPWTLLAPIGFLISLFSGALWVRKWGFRVGLMLVAAAVFLVWPHMKPASYVDRGDAFYQTNDATTTSSDELMPLWVKRFPAVRPENWGEVVGGVARVNMIYFPGWRAFVGGKEVPISYDNEFGIMEVVMKSGAGDLRLRFGDTPVRRVGNLVSVASTILLIAVVIRKNRYAV